ncbi:MAG: DUF2179 domain-containing protein [Bacillota bacterium]|jgi:uncharacterized protein YebE (UPF0316 family)
MAQALLYFAIFFAKIIEVSLMTMRVMLISRGEKLLGAVIGFVEVSIWLLVASRVIQDIQSDPLKMVVYALGFSCGIYAGTIVESKLAIGLSSVRVIVDSASSDLIAGSLREDGFGVTSFVGAGKESSKTMLLVLVKRKRIRAAIDKINRYAPDAVIAVDDTKAVQGGFLKK